MCTLKSLYALHFEAFTMRLYEITIKFLPSLKADDSCIKPSASVKFKWGMLILAMIWYWNVWHMAHPHSLLQTHMRAHFLQLHFSASARIRRLRYSTELYPLFVITSLVSILHVLLKDRYTIGKHLIFISLHAFACSSKRFNTSIVQRLKQIDAKFYASFTTVTEIFY